MSQVSKNYIDRYCNRLRVGEMEKTFKNSGFEVLDIIRKTKSIPDKIYNKIDFRYKEMPKEDIETLQCVFIIKKV